MSTSNVPATENWYASVEKTSRTDDERIKDITVLPPPEHLIRFFPIRGTAVEQLITTTRKRIHDIMAGQDDRLLVVIGPCSIHDPNAALDYARRLKEVRARYADTLKIVMRVYFEEPRTDGPHGAAGIGELPLSSPHASIINGIYNATGVRITRLPAYPEKVLAGLKK